VHDGRFFSWLAVSRASALSQLPRNRLRSAPFGLCGADLLATERDTACWWNGANVIQEQIWTFIPGGVETQWQVRLLEIYP
jgi:hypothetical protein